MGTVCTDKTIVEEVPGELGNAVVTSHAHDGRFWWWIGISCASEEAASKVQAKLRKGPIWAKQADAESNRVLLSIASWNRIEADRFRREVISAIEPKV